MSTPANIIQQSNHEIKDQRTLMAAFEQFSQLSEQLQTSYQVLDHRTEELTKELATARSERLQQLAEKEKLADRLEKLLSALPAGVVVVDAKGIIQTANMAAEKLFEQRLEGKSWQHVISVSVKKADEQGITLKNANILSMDSQKLESNEGEIILLNDVTHPRMLQDLANRQSRLAAMGEMAAGLAHQLRTPLSSAMLYVSQVDNTHLNASQQQRAVEKIRASMRYLEKLINDMLMYAKGGEFDDTKFSLNQLLVAFYSRVEIQIQQSGAKLKINNDMPTIKLTGSVDALVSVLMNLAENAIEACAPSCELELKVYQQAQHIILALKDNGPGLTEEQQAHVFEPFYTESSHGTGLGLAVAQSIARAHQGELMVKSEPQNGCTFYLCLPLNQGEQFLASGKMTTTQNIAGDSSGEFNE
jgi:two-component system, sensor histidine kinase FlrB